MYLYGEIPESVQMIDILFTFLTTQHCITTQGHQPEKIFTALENPALLRQGVFGVHQLSNVH